MKRWKIECDNTQYILCPVCLMFLVEFGVWIWRTYKLWLIIDGTVTALAACRLSCCLYVDMRSLVCWTGDASRSVLVAYFAYKDMWSSFFYTLCADCIGEYIACCVRWGLVNELLKWQYVNENSALACGPWIGLHIHLHNPHITYKKPWSHIFIGRISDHHTSRRIPSSTHQTTHIHIQTTRKSTRCKDHYNSIDNQQ
jgi:hypothetical protein